MLQARGGLKRGGENLGGSWDALGGELACGS